MSTDTNKAIITEERARVIIKHISDAAIELACIRHSLTSDEFDLDEAFLDDIKTDVLEVLTGDETGCLLPEELDETNCVRLWLQSKALEKGDSNR